jgi:hypothetical protein
LCNNPTLVFASLLFDDDSSRVTNVGAEQLLAESEDGDAGWATEADIEGPFEEGFVAIQKSIVKGNAHFVSVELLLFLLPLQLLLVLLQHVAHLQLQLLGQILLQVPTHFLPVLTVPISHCKEMRVFQSAEVRSRNEGILVHFVRVTGREACLRGVGKLRHRVSEHLLWVAWIVSKWSHGGRVHRLLRFLGFLRSGQWWVSLLLLGFQVALLLVLIISLIILPGDALWVFAAWWMLWLIFFKLSWSIILSLALTSSMRNLTIVRNWSNWLYCLILVERQSTIKADEVRGDSNIHNVHVDVNCVLIWLVMS